MDQMNSVIAYNNRCCANVVLLSSLYLLINRKLQGAYHNLLQEMRLTDSDKYFNYLRMSSENFTKLLSLVGPKLTKVYCVREPLPPGERLAATLR